MGLPSRTCLQVEVGRPSHAALCLTLAGCAPCPAGPLGWACWVLPTSTAQGCCLPVPASLPRGDRTRPLGARSFVCELGQVPFPEPWGCPHSACHPHRAASSPELVCRSGSVSPLEWEPLPLQVECPCRWSAGQIPLQAQNRAY